MKAITITLAVLLICSSTALAVTYNSLDNTKAELRDSELIADGLRVKVNDVQNNLDKQTHCHDIAYGGWDVTIDSANILIDVYNGDYTLTSAELDAFNELTDIISELTVGYESECQTAPSLLQ